jgi:hypothetical protein
LFASADPSTSFALNQVNVNKRTHSDSGCSRPEWMFYGQADRRAISGIGIYHCPKHRNPMMHMKIVSPKEQAVGT